MGGGGGGGRDTLGDISGLEKKAKELIKQSEERKNVFISFAYEDFQDVQALRAQSANDNNDIAFNDYSVKEPFDSERADYIKQKLAERINQSSTTVVYLSPETSRSQWVKWEVEKSLALGKKVIAMHKGDAPPSNQPSWVNDHGVKVVSWSKLSDEMSKG
ncbi:TIR domain-containing protein [Magnetococcus sp. PR-3]|uniref:TIR domain-containing protein n=1 Tax=Magnetococcus sp. PR-3 TaxID=3120355 RepID=UPI002FCDE51C